MDRNKPVINGSERAGARAMSRMTVKSPLKATPGHLGRYDKGHRSDLAVETIGNPLDLADCHLLSNVKQESSVAIFDATHEPAKLVQKTSFFPGTSPNNIVGAFALRKVGEDGRFFSVIEELVEWDFQSARYFLERFNGRNCMAIFHARNIATKQSCALFDVPLGKLLFFAQGAKPISNNHVGIVS
jgi:hypothetical protein